MKTAGLVYMVVAMMLVFAGEVHAEMSSTNYRLYGDSFGSVGGRGSSTNYLLEGTGEDSPVGEGSSTNYVLLAGFQSLSEHPTFSFSVSASTISFGTLLMSSVASQAYTVTTSTNAPYGYTTTIYEDGEFRVGSSTIDDVADGTVTSGSEEYGIAASSTDAAFGTDQGITSSGTVVASRTNWINGSTTTVTHKAAINSGTTAGTYGHTVTYMSTGNF